MYVIVAAGGCVASRLSHDAGQVQRPIIERLAEQRDLAAAAIDSGAARDLLARWGEVSRELS